MIENPNHSFEIALGVQEAEIEYLYLGITEIEWHEFLLNPRRLRGSDFLMRWSQGVWSEHRLREAINNTKSYFCIAYGPSGVAPHENVREFELYFERLEAAGLGKIKRPDLMVFKKEDKEELVDLIKSLGGETELPFINEDSPEMKRLLGKAIAAIECENSLWRCKNMPDFGSEMRAQKRLNGKLGLPKGAVLPTIIVKTEDLHPLEEWQKKNKVPIHIWHVFFDRAYGISFDTARGLIKDGLINETLQVFQAPGGATSSKGIYKFYYHYAYLLGVSVEDPKLVPAIIEDKNGHILPYVTFSGGKLELDQAVFEVLENL